MRPWIPYVSLSIVGLAIWLAWVRHSRRWNKQEKLAQLLRENPNALIAKEAGFDRFIPAPKTVGVTTQRWTSCDIYSLEEGLVLAGLKNSDGFRDCILLRYPSASWFALPGCLMRARYNPPVYFDGKLIFDVLLSESTFLAWGAEQIVIELSVDKTTADRIIHLGEISK